MTQEQVEAASALLGEVLLHMRRELFCAEYARDRYMQALAQDGWPHGEIGHLFGVTKQRVQQILKTARRDDRLSRRLGLPPRRRQATTR